MKEVCIKKNLILMIIGIHALRKCSISVKEKEILSFETSVPMP